MKKTIFTIILLSIVFPIFAQRLPRGTDPHSQWIYDNEQRILKSMAEQERRRNSPTPEEELPQWLKPYKDIFGYSSSSWGHFWTVYFPEITLDIENPDFISKLFKDTHLDSWIQEHNITFSLYELFEGASEIWDGYDIRRDRPGFYHVHITAQINSDGTPYVVMNFYNYESTAPTIYEPARLTDPDGWKVLLH